METSLVKISGNELHVGTWNLSKGFGIEHRILKRFITKYEEDFKEFGFSITTQWQRRSEGHGGQVEEYVLTEQQAVYLTTLFTNNEKVRKFKKMLTKEFFKQRDLLNKIILQKQNSEWLEKRASGKIERRAETDTIKEFVEYAKSQGSKNAEKYYMIISKMENQSLFALDFMGQKFPNLREIVDGFALDALKMADRAVAKALKDGMGKNTFYKEIYQSAKERVEMFAIAIGKTPLRLILQEKSG